ncbi:MAG: selenocysteine-specific translation elongation factor [Desulfurivibrionaceae bacterium]|nr:selenocysteine-specific translation elongation factor [Desulfurivibrionaceae bacterium]
MREIVLGTAGHVDHGKTSLVRALTGIETDRLREEQKRGITIELGFAFLDQPCGHRLGIVDVPGHEKFIKNMVAGASGIDLVAFVIAADEGIMPQTKEHFEICRLLGIDKGLIIVTKKDMVDPEWLELVTEDIRDFFTDTFLDDAPLLVVSSVTGEGIDEVKEVLDRLVAKCDFAESHGPFRLPVDRVFAMKGFGAVVTGTSISGRIHVGDEVEIFPHHAFGKIRGIQSHGQGVELVEAGKRTAINLQGVDRELIRRGDMLITPGCLQPTFMLDARFFHLSSREKPLKNRSRVRIHLGSAEIMGRLVLLEDEVLAAGGETNVQILLEEPVGVWPGDRYVVRSYSPVTTIGGGVIYGVSPRKRRRFKPENQEAFQVYAQGDQVEICLLHLRESGFQGLTFDELAVRTGIFGNRLQKLLSGPVSASRIMVVESERKLMVSRERFDALAGAITEALSRYHLANPLKTGLAKEELRSRLFGGQENKTFQAVLNNLLKKGVIAAEDSLLRLAGHKVVFRADEQEVQAAMLAMYEQAGLVPPTYKEVLARFPDLAPDFVKEMLLGLVQSGKVVKVNEDLYFYKGHLDRLQEELVTFMRKAGDIDAPRFKGLTGLTRKFSIPLLEYFDKEKITLRVGDTRILREKR